MNEAKKLNSLAVLEEEKKAVDPYYEKNKKKEITKQKQERKKQELVQKGFETNQAYMQSSAKQQLSTAPKDKHNTSDNFGWNIFNTDTLYSAYEKRCAGIAFNEEDYKAQMQNPDEQFQPSEEALQRLQ